MEGPRSPQPNELSHILNFLNTSLRAENSWSIANEYPTAFHPNNIHNMRIITDENQVLSHAVLKPIIVKTPTIVFKVGAIGSVVTADQFRGQGLSKKILENCLELATEQNCDIAILWTNLYDFYRKVGFELAGTEVTATYDKELSTPAHDLKFLTSHRVSAEAILKLYQKHTVHSYRTVDDIQRYLQIPNTKVYTAWDKNGTLCAFAIEGKGADLQGYIHEWSGSLPHLIALFNFILKDRKNEFNIICSQNSSNLLGCFKLNKLVLHYGYLGMIKILNHQALFEKINRAAKNVGILNFNIERTDQGTKITIQQERIAINDDKQLTQLLFGPELPAEFLKEKTEFSHELSNILPLNIWLWGWDSI